MASKWADVDVEAIYQAYPRHVGPRAAKRKIRKALDLIEKEHQMGLGRGAVAWLTDRVCLFANSPAGQAGHYTPHPATWFHQGRYDDDPRTWQERPTVESRGLTVDDVRRQMEGDAPKQPRCADKVSHMHWHPPSPLSSDREIT